jgi:hypothetical protein
MVSTSQDVEAGGCNCLAGQDGNFCKHRAAVLLKLGLSDVDIRRRWGTLYGTNQATEPAATQVCRVGFRNSEYNIFYGIEYVL